MVWTAPQLYNTAMPDVAAPQFTKQRWCSFVSFFVATIAIGMLLIVAPHGIMQVFRINTSKSTPMPIARHLQGPTIGVAQPQGWFSGVPSRLSPLKNDLGAIFGMLMGEKSQLVAKDKALPGRDQPMSIVNQHYVLKTPIQPPFPQGMETVVFGTGCFWGTEKMFWKLPGVYSTAVGYAAGYTPNPTYEEVCSGKTGHNEVVLVVYDPKKVSFADLLRNFWESHDPTQGMGQGNDRGTQYRSGIYPTNEVQKRLAESSLKAYQAAIAPQGYSKITTEIVPNVEFYYAENYHQQYLAKPFSRPYCSAQPSGISLPPFEKWAPAGLEQHTSKLPDAYWEKYGPKPGCTIKGPNAPNQWP